METDEELGMSRKIVWRQKINLINTVLTIAILFCNFILLNAQPVNNELPGNENHILTIYVLKSASPLNWETPETLYKTYRRSVLTNFMKKERTLKGHFFISLYSPLIDSPIYAGVSSADKKEEKKCIFLDKIGLGVLGVCMKGCIQGKDELLKKIEFHAKKNDIAFIKFKISKTAAQHVIDFYKIYTTECIANFSPSDFYGGAFYPLYENEGAGCSAFALAVLELAGVNDIETVEWYKKLNIPMNLIGGEMNGNRKIKVRDIKKSHSWQNGEGIENVDFVPYLMCDPSTAYNWILEHRKNENLEEHPGYIAATESGIPGLYTDRSFIEIDNSNPIIIKRPDKNFFVEYHFSRFKTVIEPK